MTVEPCAPRDIHVGEGGDRVAAAFGEHDASQTGSGLTSADVRKYVPGDSVRQIDWKAMARLDEPHVREFETDLETVLFVDHRATMAMGQRGERKLDFTRMVALTLVESAQELGDPLACSTVGDGGITNTFEPSTADGQYRTIARRLRALEPTDDSAERHPSEPSEGIDPAQARRTADRLSGDDPFAERLRPFFAAADTYIQQVAEQPLFAGIQTSTARLDGTVRTIIVTDNECQTELREAVKVARKDNGQVVVFLTPSVLYGSRTLADVDAAYQRYTDFERFRRELASLPRVTAFEVGPEDRLTTVLATGRRQQRAEQ